jgi:hypothetical protein
MGEKTLNDLSIVVGTAAVIVGSGALFGRFVISAS